MPQNLHLMASRKYGLKSGSFRILLNTWHWWYLALKIMIIVYRHHTCLEVITPLFRCHGIYLSTKSLAFPWTHSCHDLASQVLPSYVHGFVCLISLLCRVIPDTTDGNDGSFHVWQYLLFRWRDTVPKIHSSVACWGNSYPSHIWSPPGGSSCITYVLSHALLTLCHCKASIHYPSVWAFVPKGYMLAYSRSSGHFYHTCNLNLWTLLGSCQILSFLTSCEFVHGLWIMLVKWLLCSLLVYLGAYTFV